MTYGYLSHHGVKGMRWGVRNYQNADGSLTAEGRQRYGIDRKGGKSPNALSYGKAHKTIQNQMKTERLKNIFSKGSLKEKHERGSLLNKEYKEQRKLLDKEYDKKYGEGTAKKLHNKNNAVAAALTVGSLAIITAGTIGALKASGVTRKGENSIPKGTWEIPVGRMERYTWDKTFGYNQHNKSSTGLFKPKSTGITNSWGARFNMIRSPLEDQVKKY